MKQDTTYACEIIDLTKDHINQIKKAYDTNKYRYLSAYYKSVLEEMPHNPSFALKYRKQFIDNFPIDLFDLYKKRKKKIESVLKRGKINNKEEYYIMKEYADQLCQSQSDQTTLELTNKTLGEFEMKNTI